MVHGPSTQKHVIKFKLKGSSYCIGLERNFLTLVKLQTKSQSKPSQLWRTYFPSCQ